MGFARIDGIAAEGVNDLEVMTEHVRVLVILLGDVLSKRGGERELYGLSEGERQDAVAAPLSA